MEYDLGRLSSASFESLVQALATAEIESPVSVFGMGRDGGREATFNNPATATIRGGYGVIQAKFRQRPRGGGDDTTWALQQLETEIAAFSDHTRKRKVPQHYIFATNVTLTPYPELGGKDVLASRLEEWAQQSQLEGFEIWDSDQLCTLLDVHAGVRQTYASFILSGDILTHIASEIGLADEAFGEIAALYLQKELFRDQNALLEQGGHSQDDSISLANVFIDVPIEVDEGAPRPTTSKFMKRLFECGDAIPSSGVSLRKDRQVPGKIVLVGGPGQGKTTVGQYACQLYRAALLKDVDEADLEVQSKDIVSQLLGRLEDQGVALPACQRFPIRVILSEFADQLSEDSQLTLLQFIVGRIGRRSGRQISVTSLSRFLERYPFIVVFDGLDEVPGGTNRDAVIEAIRDFQIDVHTRGLNSLVLITTRPQGYNNELSPAHYSHWKLAHLDPATALAYGDLLAAERFGANEEREAKVKVRLRRALELDRTSRLMISPLQVTIMVLLVDQQGDVPEERWELFNGYYDLICQRETERDIPASFIIREYRQDIDAIHASVALKLQHRGSRKGGTESKLTKDEFEAVVYETLVSRQYSASRAAELTGKIVDASAFRLVFLVGIEEGAIGFEIRSLQEFMSAEALMSVGDEIAVRRLRAISQSSYWRNVFLFASGKTLKQKYYLGGEIVLICEALNDESSKTDSVFRPGSRLAISLLLEGGARRNPSVAKPLARLALRILRGTPNSLSRMLDRCATLDTAEVFAEELELLLGTLSENLDILYCYVSLVEQGLLSSESWTATLAKRPEILAESRQWQVAATVAQNNRKLIDSVSESSNEIDPLPIFAAAGGLGLYHDSRFKLRRAENWPSLIQRIHQFGVRMEVVERSAIFLDMNLCMTVSVCAAQSKSFEGLLVPALPAQMSFPSEWRALQAVANFILSPNADSLAQALLSIVPLAESDSPDAENFIQIVKHLGPWPLAACLAWEREDGYLSLLASQCLEGKLGDLADWESMESSWEEFNASVEASIRYSPLDLPYDAFDARLYPLSFLQQWNLSSTNDVNFLNMDAFIDRVVAGFQEAGSFNEPERREVGYNFWRATLSFTLVHNAARGQGIFPDNVTGPQLNALFSSYPDIAAKSSSYMIPAIPMVAIHEEIRELNGVDLDAFEAWAWGVLGNQGIGYPEDHSTFPFDAREALRSNPWNLGALVQLAHESTQSEKDYRPIDLSFYSPESIDQNCPITHRDILDECLLLLEVRQNGFAALDVDWILSVVESSDSVMEMMADAFYASGRPFAEYESFLKSGLSRRPRNWLGSALEAEIAEVHDATDTALDDLEKWVALELPIFAFDSRAPTIS